MLATSAGIGLFLAHIGLQSSEGLGVVSACCVNLQCDQTALPLPSAAEYFSCQMQTLTNCTCARLR